MQLIRSPKSQISLIGTLSESLSGHYGSLHTRLTWTYFFYSDGSVTWGNIAHIAYSLSVYPDINYYNRMLTELDGLWPVS